jgi:PKD repeat protein
MDMDDAGDLYLQMGIDAGFQGVLPEAWFANAYQKIPHVHPSTYHEGDTGIIKVSNDGTKVYWATWIGGSKGNITKASVHVGRDRCPVLWMPTMSADVPTTPGAYCRTMAVPDDADIGGRDGLMWLGKLSADGSCLLFGTYVGKGYLPCHDIALDANGDIFVAAFQTGGGPWPVTPNAFQTKYGGGTHGMVVAKFSPSGKLLAGTHLGGKGGEFDCPDTIALDGQGNLLLVGWSKSVDYPVTAGAFQSKNEGANHAVFSLLSNDLSTMLYSSYFGTSSRANGAWGDMFRACAIGQDGTLYLAGSAAPFFPVRNAHQGKFGGGPCDGQIVKVSPARPVPVIVETPTARPHTVTVGRSVAFRVRAADPEGSSLSYRWDFGDFSSNSVAYGATATHSYAEPGTYKVTVAAGNGSGGLATAPLPVTVLAVPGAPVIVVQPAPQSVAMGRSVTLSVAAKGQKPLNYQWQRYGVNIPGATSATLPLPAAQVADSGTYRVVVTNSAGSAMSNYVDCQVYEPPAITAMSVDKDRVLRVVATGTRLNYRWQDRGKDIRNATAAIYVMPRGAADDPSVYTVVVSNPAGSVSSRGTPLIINK